MRTLGEDLSDTIDFVLLGGPKALYPEVLGLVACRLRLATIIVAADADNSPQYLEHFRSPANGYMSIPFGNDVELSVRVH